MEKKLILAQFEATQKQLQEIIKNQNNLKTLIEESQEQEIDSSFIDEYYYFELSEVLCIQFKSKSLWSYRDVTLDDYNKFRGLCEELDSCGKAYNKVIKGQFKSEQIYFLKTNY